MLEIRKKELKNAYRFQKINKFIWKEKKMIGYLIIYCEIFFFT